MFHRSLVRAGFAAGALALTLVVAGCGSSSTSGDTHGATSGGLSGKKIAFVGYGTASPWGAAFNKKFKQDLSGSGAQIQDLTTMDSGEQVQKFNQAVAAHPDIIVTALLDTAAMVVPIQKAKQAGIPVLAFDAAPDPKVADDVMGIYSDNPALGRAAATNIVEGLAAQGKKSGRIIVLSGTKSMLLTSERMQGFNAVLAKHPGLKVIADEDTNWDPTLSGQVAQRLFAKYGCSGIDAAYGMADYMAVPIVQAAKQAGCTIGGKSGIVITGGNCFKAGIDAIRSGDMYGTATEDPITLADLTAQYLKDYYSGNKPPRVKMVKEMRVTAKNLDKFAAQCSQA